MWGGFQPQERKVEVTVPCVDLAYCYAALASVIYSVYTPLLKLALPVTLPQGAVSMDTPL